MSVADDLDAAADLIETVGWWKNDDAYEDAARNGARCAVLAICHVTRRHRSSVMPAYVALAAYIGLEGDLDLNDVYRWNDSHDSPFPVIDALRHAAKELRNA